ncbi:MAG: ankyrin repeat domain-containing protein [Candidatus Aenigmarchaeota archaeon]|nr:ankyrin repeat domain-containing protein [Candidatus Aenigmarchaeota archaeon]
METLHYIFYSATANGIFNGIYCNHIKTMLKDVDFNTALIIPYECGMESFVNCAIKQGNQNLIKYACNRPLTYEIQHWNAKAYEIAADRGDLETIKYLHSHEKMQRIIPWNIETFMAAGAHLDCLKYIYEEYKKLDKLPKLDNYIFHKAADGHLDCLKYFIEVISCNRGDIQNYQYIYVRRTIINNLINIAAAGHLDCLKYLHKKGYNWGVNTAKAAAEHLDCLRYLRENGCDWDAEAIDVAAQGHLECLIYLHRESLAKGENCPWSVAVCANAAKGHLDCLKYAHENGCLWDMESIKNAAQGHLDCLKYLHENGCPWDSSIIINMAIGHLDCLKYIHENSCPLVKTGMHSHNDECLISLRSTECLTSLRSAECLTKEIFNAAAKGHLDCLEYLHKNRCPHDENAMIIAASGNIDCLSFLCEKKYTITTEVFNAAATGHITCLRCLCRSYPKSSKNYIQKSTINAAAGGYFGCLEYLYQESISQFGYCQWDSSSTEIATTSGNLDCLKYLITNSCPCNFTSCYLACQPGSKCIDYLCSQAKKKELFEHSDEKMLFDKILHTELYNNANINLRDPFEINIILNSDNINPICIDY